MAAHEVHVARYYLRAARTLPRPTAPRSSCGSTSRRRRSQDALQIMVQAYAGLSMPQLSDDAKRVLDTNFPASIAVVQEKAPWWKFW